MFAGCVSRVVVNLGTSMSVVLEAGRGWRR
ncbi:MAG: hypothetical protein KDA68_20175 [Planctomycetaceae bacterium]|nr:hypothetical protein [Planctomycetaceae bacterium]